MPANERLERILYILPAAAQAGGTTLTALANTLGVPVETIFDDLDETAARVYYHAGGTDDEFGILVGRDWVQVRPGPDFKRPVGLNQGEALALGLGLRTLAANADPARRADIHKLATRLEKKLRAPTVELQPQPGRNPPADDANLDSEQFDVALDESDTRGSLADAIEQRRVCGIEYLKAGEPKSQQRRVAPWRLLYANGRWYLIAFDQERGDARRFRMDRMLKVEQLDKRFDPPAQSDVERALTSFVTDPDDEIEAVVRYSPRIARWIAEHYQVEPAADGSVRVKHTVADARWLVRHVLQYGGEAVVETPPKYRKLITEHLGVH